MKTLILICLIVVFGFGNECKLYTEKAQTELRGIKISYKDKDILGIRASCVGFRINSKLVLQKCPNTTEATKKGRKNILSLCETITKI